jgi:hypothetical protein
MPQRNSMESILTGMRTCKLLARLDCLWVGHPMSHAVDVYKFMSLKTKKVTTRNVIWLDKNCTQFKGIKAVTVEQITPIGSEQKVIEEEVDAGADIEEVIEKEDKIVLPILARTPVGDSHDN